MKDHEKVYFQIGAKLEFDETNSADNVKTILYYCNRMKQMGIFDAATEKIIKKIHDHAVKIVGDLPEEELKEAMEKVTKCTELIKANV